jgi:serpin B
MMPWKRRMAERSNKAQNCSSGEAVASSNAEAERAAAEASTAFALAVYGELVGEAENLFVASASILAALTMAWLGSQGETAAELERSLRLPLDSEALRRTLMALSSQAYDRPGCEVSIANALWVSERYPLLAEYLAFIREHFGAAVQQADFAAVPEETRRAINSWVTARTKGHIRDMIEPGTFDELTRLVLVNAIYFKGTWEATFQSWLTELQPFQRVDKAPIDVPLMHRDGFYRLVEYPDLQVLALPYKGGTPVLVVLLPRQPEGLRDLERKLDAVGLCWIFEQLEQADPRQMEVYLPRFRVEASFRLDAALKRLGAARAFDQERADFSSMSADAKGLYIAAVLHKAFVDVDEEGTVAAAVTATDVSFFGTGPPEEVTAVFRADRPFLFVIRDALSGIVLFVGRVVDPTA